MAWRDIWRHKARWSLSVILIAGSIATGVALTATELMDWERYNARQLLGAEVIVSGSSIGAGALRQSQADLDQWSDTMGRPDAVRQIIDVDSGDGWYSVAVMDPTSPMAMVGYPLGEGRLPAAPNEVLIPDRSEWSVGDTVVVPGYGTVVVVGSTSNMHLEKFLALVPPEGVDIDYVDYTAFYSHVPPVLTGGSVAFAENPAGPGNSVETAAFGALVTLAGAAFVILVVAAVFQASLSRRLREVGLIQASAGAEPAHTWSLPVASGSVLGTIGATLGLALGVLVARIIYFGDVVYDGFGWFDFNQTAFAPDFTWFRWEYFPSAIVGLLAAVVGSLYPVIRLRKLSVVQALSHAWPSGSAWRFSAASGAVLLLAGFILILIPFYDFGDVTSNVTGGVGVALMVAGVAAVAVATMSGLTKTPALSVWTRIAIRDVDRNRTQSALGAAFIGLGMTMLMVAPEEVVWPATLAAVMLPVGFVWLLLNESGRQLELMRAVGGSRHARRHYAAALGFVLTMAGVLGAIPAASLITAASFGLYLESNPWAIPGVALAFLVLVPLAVWLGTRSKSELVTARV